MDDFLSCEMCGKHHDSITNRENCCRWTIAKDPIKQIELALHRKLTEEEKDIIDFSVRYGVKNHSEIVNNKCY